MGREREIEDEVAPLPGRDRGRTATSKYAALSDIVQRTSQSFLSEPRLFGRSPKGW